jgi:hypothetical protein
VVQVFTLTAAAAAQPNSLGVKFSKLLPKSCRVCDEFVNTSLSLRLLVAKSESYLFVYFFFFFFFFFLWGLSFLVVMFMSCNL